MKPTIVASVSRCLACSAFHETIISASSSMALITSLDVNRDNVAQLATCGRARWKIENEGFNLLKNNSYHAEHNFRHGLPGTVLSAADTESDRLYFQYCKRLVV